MKLRINNKFTQREIDLDINSVDIVVAGLRDAHCHLMWLGLNELGLNLENCNSFNEVLEKTLIYSKTNKNSWIVGRGWNEENWDKKEIDFVGELDRYFPNIPVYLKRVDGHSAILNSKALQICNINSKTKDPDGGRIYKDTNGNPTGLLIDNALEIANSYLPKFTDDEIINYILVAQEKCLTYGLVEVHDMDVYLDWLPAFEHLANERKLDLKIISYIRAFDEEFLSRKISPKKLRNFEIKGLKFYADGALGSRGALLIDAYSDDNGNSGISLIQDYDLIRIAEIGANFGFEIATHAIGDLANRIVLDTYGKLRSQGVNVPLRIEHSQMVHPNDILKFKVYNVTASIQPIHCISDEKMAESRIGERISYAYPWASLVQNGVNVIGGSDFPIESLDPLLGIQALVNPLIEWQESEKVSLDTALTIYGAIK